MNHRIRSAVYLLTALVYWVAATGLVVVSHTCRSEGVTEVSLFTRSGCCSETSVPSAGDSDQWEEACCQLSMSYDKIESLSVEGRLFQLDLVQAPVMLPFSSRLVLFQAGPVIQDPFYKPPSSRPFPGAELRISLGQWLV